jgi:hypothetical protein
MDNPAECNCLESIEQRKIMELNAYAEGLSINTKTNNISQMSVPRMVQMGMSVKQIQEYLESQ